MKKETPYEILLKKLDKAFPDKFGAQLILASIATEYAGATLKPIIEALQGIKRATEGEMAEWKDCASRVNAITTKALESISQILAES